jgi:hypothetical protein
VRLEGSRNLVFCAAAVAGLLAAVARSLRREATRELRAATWLCGAALATLWVLPHPFPYQHVPVLPLIAVLAAVACVRGAARIGLRGPLALGTAVVALLVAAAATSLPRLATAMRRTHAQQLALLERIGRITAPDEPVFDLVGLYFRPDAYPIYLMTGAHFARYRSGGFPPIAQTLSHSRPALIGFNYRTRWLEGEDRDFIRAHYVHYDGNLFVPGRGLASLEPGAQQAFEVLRRKPFAYRGDGVLQVDGVPFTRGTLEVGVHTLSSPTGIRTGVLVQELPEEPPLRPEPVSALYTPFD